MPHRLCAPNDRRGRRAMSLPRSVTSMGFATRHDGQVRLVPVRGADWEDLLAIAVCGALIEAVVAQAASDVFAALGRRSCKKVVYFVAAYVRVSPHRRVPRPPGGARGGRGLVDA